MAPDQKLYTLPFGFQKAAVQTKGADLTASIVAATGVFTTATHGFAIGDRVVLSVLASTTGIAINTYYYVITVPASTTFTLSATSGGSALTLTTNGTATLAKLFESRAQLANKITSTSKAKDVDYEGDNIIIPVHNLQSISFTFDTAAFTIGAHATIFGLSQVTTNLPDSYTGAYGLFGSAVEQTGQTAGFWGEAAETNITAAGVQSSKTARYWYPLGLISASKPPELTTSDKPPSWQYFFNVSNMSPLVDVMGVALPVTGSPLIVMDK